MYIGLLLSALSVFSDLCETPILAVIMHVSRYVSMCRHYAVKIKTRRQEISRPTVSAAGETLSCHSSGSQCVS